MIESLGARVKRLSDRIDEFSLRERLLIFVAMLAVLYVGATTLLFAPLQGEQARLQKELVGKRQQMQRLETQLQQILARGAQDPDAENRAKLAALQERLGTIDAALAEQTAGLVSPQEMARLVEQILKENRRLELIKVESLSPSPLVDKSEEGEENTVVAEEPEQVIYKHGMRIEFEGRYLDIVDYLKTLEALPWKVFWGEATLEAEEYPLSRFVLVLYTLSLREGWIGV